VVIFHFFIVVFYAERSCLLHITTDRKKPFSRPSDVGGTHEPVKRFLDRDGSIVRERGHYF